MSRPACLACAVALAISVSGALATLPCDAAPASKVSPRDRDRAEKAYQASLDLYRKGQYRAAIEKLEDARAIDPEAKELPYNLGLVHEKLGEIDDAIRYFELYLTLETDETERDRVRATIRRLAGAKRDLKPAASASAAPPPPPPHEDEKPPPPPPPHAGRLDGWVYGTGGLAIAALAGGAFFGVRALSKHPSSPATGNGQTIGDLQSSADDAHRSAVVADVLFGVGIASGVAAALLYFGRDAEPAADAAVLPIPRGVAGTVRVRF